jgi:hypothetical protein
MNTRRGWQRVIHAGDNPRAVLVAASVVFTVGLLSAFAGTAHAANNTPPFKSLNPEYNPHGSYSTTSDQCGTCHRMHGDGRESFTNLTPTSHAVDCLSCHDGTGALSNVSTEYSAVATPNVPSTRSYYTHDALAVNTGHLAASSDEEGGSLAAEEFAGVSNRHSDCVDCHNPHASLTTPISTEAHTAGASTGWLISGALQSVSVVTVSGTFVGHATTTENHEYALCLKCHSAYTTLGAPIAGRPSLDWLDKAAEINPATPGNNSMHPIMAMGTNHTETMTANLAGTSAYKRWTFSDSDTVRCTNCHANSAGTGTAGQGMPTHASPNRGILILPYQDRVLLSSSDTATTSRFALCFACHSDVPFKSASSGQKTAFDLHYAHMASYKGNGTPRSGSVTIDTADAGNGFPLCAECHFRLHSTKNAFNVKAPGNPSGQDITGTRLVNFAPNVTASASGVLNWTPRVGSFAGSCELTCHGFDHGVKPY